MAKDRKPAEVERDRRNIARLYLQGHIQAEIAHALGISQPTVSRELKVLQQEWKTERVYDINEAKIKELEKLDILEREYWDAWKRSQEDGEVNTKGTQVGGKIDITRTEKQIGDPRFLEGVQGCIKIRCSILGVEAPKKTENILKNIDFGKLSDDQLRRIENGEEVLNVLISGPG